MRIVASFDPGAATSGSFNAQFSNSQGRIVVYNESAINLALSWSGFQTYCPAWTAMLYCIQTPKALVTWTQISQLTTAPGPIRQVTVEAFDNNEPILGTYPAQLGRQTTVVNSGQNAFSTTLYRSSTVNNTQLLNVFNPPTSRVVCTFYSAKVFTNDNNAASYAALVLHSGADLNLFLGALITSKDGGAVQPVSACHASAQDSTVTPPTGTYLEYLSVPANTTVDFHAFPDVVTLEPGNNLFLLLNTSATGLVTRMVFKWTETAASGA